MSKPPLATTISSLLVCSIVSAPVLTYAQGVHGVADREVARRHAAEGRARENINRGDRAMKDKDYALAVEYYRTAVDDLGSGPNTASVYNAALDRFCDASCKLAEQRITEGRFGDAEKTVRKVLEDRYDPRCHHAVVLLARLEQPDYYNKTIGPQFRASVEKVKQWFIEAQGFYDTGRYDLAKKRCDQILGVDKYNIAARAMQERIDRAISDYGVQAYNETRSEMIKQVDLSWQRPVRKYAQGEIIKNDTEPVQTNLTERIRRKLETIIIPKLEFREATIREAIDFLKKKSVELDPSPAGEKGVNIVLKLEPAPGGAPAGLPEAAPAVPGIPGLDPVPAAPGAAPGAAPAPAFGNPADARITVSLSNIPLIEALRYVTGLANLKFKVEPYAVSVVPLSEPTDVLITKEWRIPPDLIPRTQGAGGAAGGGLAAPAFGAAAGGPADATKGGSGIADRESAKNWLIANGVTFAGAASAIYIVRTSRLIVRNTQDQLDLIETIIETGGKGLGPTQIEVEAKFVEITQNTLKELSFDWLVGAFNVDKSANVFAAGGTPGTAPATAIQDFPFILPGGTVPVGTNPVTGGTRSGANAISANAIDALLFGANGASRLAPGIAALAGVFTDPQFQLVIRALNQKKGVDLLSAPRVTTKSGQRAVIEIIREFRYPTEFDPPQIPQNFGGGTLLLTGFVTPPATASTFPVTPTTPTAFETRNTGVTLEVEPVVGPDSYTIDLNLVPQVVEFEGFINYGSPILAQDILGNSVVITPNVINQPIFSTRKVTTSVSVFDGATVMLGGLIREDVQKVEDKVPILGDIPVLGRLFRSSVDQHLKRNLIIFVTARLISPSGDIVHPDDEKEEVIETLLPPTIMPLELPMMSK